MAKYIFKRFCYMAAVFFIISFLMYALYNLIPTDPARAQLESVKSSLRPAEYQQQYEELRASMGLDAPLVVRYLRWMGIVKDVNGDFDGLLEGNLGYSQVYKKDVISIVGEPMKNTIFLNVFSTILSLGITIPLGISCAVKKQSRFDNGVQAVTILGYSLPVYIIALIMIYLFCVVWRIFPVMGSKTPGIIYQNGFEAFIDKLYYMALPMIVMTFASLGGMTRYVRASMIEALDMDYIRTARAKGVKEKVVIYSHAWRNALLPVITSIIGWFLGIFGGSVVIENTFSLNGMGKLYWQGLSALDFELVLAMQMFYTIVALIGSLLMDLSYGLVDPRVRINR